MHNRAFILAVAVATAITLSVTTSAHAESSSDTGVTPLSAASNLDFRIIIPSFLTFQVGTSGATIDLIDFDLSAASPSTIGNSTPQNASSGGDISPGVVTASVVSNAGQVTITESNAGGAGLATGLLGAEIPYSEILTSSNNSDLPAPTLSDAGGNTSTPTLNSGNVTNRQAQWTYTYANTTIPDAGTYGGGAGVTNGRVTYTASIP